MGILEDLCAYSIANNFIYYIKNFKRTQLLLHIEYAWKMTRIYFWMIHFLSIQKKSFLWCMLLPSFPVGSVHSLLVTQIKEWVCLISEDGYSVLHLKGNWYGVRETKSMKLQVSLLDFSIFKKTNHTENSETSVHDLIQKRNKGE